MHIDCYVVNFHGRKLRDLSLLHFNLLIKLGISIIAAHVSWESL